MFWLLTQVCWDPLDSRQPGHEYHSHLQQLPVMTTWRLTESWNWQMMMMMRCWWHEMYFVFNFLKFYVHLDSWVICGEDIITWKSDQLKMLFEGICHATFWTWFCHLYLYPPQKTFHWYLPQQPGQDKSNNLFIFSTLSDLIAADCLEDKLTFSGRFFIINIKLCLVRNCSCTLYFFALIFSLKGLHPHRTRNRFCWKSSSFSCLK